jgi:hypothetical protein
MSAFFRSVRLIRRPLINPSTFQTRRTYAKMLQMMENPRPLTQQDGPLVWIDCEMTGLNHKEDLLLEIAVIITNGNLQRVHEGRRHVIRRDKKDLEK